MGNPFIQSIQAGKGGVSQLSAPTISTSNPFIRSMQGPAPTQVSITQPPPSTKEKIFQGARKFLARTVVSFADLITESLDFTTNFIVKNPIFKSGEGPGEVAMLKITEKMYGKESKQLKAQKEKINRWKDFFIETAAKPKQAVDRIQQAEYLQPSEEWSKAPLKEKMTKHLGETLAILGPNIIPSFALYAVNPVLGVSVTIASTANDVKIGAVENGVPEEKAELLGLGTGILVGALDRIVPDELFSPAQKSKFIGGFVKRIIPLSLKEAGTEVA